MHPSFGAIQEKFLFLHKFIQSPSSVGSITPSSPSLARAMLRDIPWDRVASVAELGAGTGAITRELAKVVSPRTRVLLFEQDPRLRAQLQTQFHGFARYPDACELYDAMSAERLEGLDVVLSGLPFFNFPQPVRERLLSELKRSLKPGGYFVAFQYSLQMKQQLAAHFELERIRCVPFNLPPAFVYICRNKAHG